MITHTFFRTDVGIPQDVFDSHLVSYAKRILEQSYIALKLHKNDDDLFTRFCREYNVVQVTAGLAAGVNGQTIEISGVKNLPNIDQLLVYKDTELNLNYRYKFLREPADGFSYILEETYLPFKSVPKPRNFLELKMFLLRMGSLSEVTHKLDLYKVVIMEDGIYLKVRAREARKHRTLPVMNC